MIRTPFNLLCSGITNCGKTKFILDLIWKHYKFDRILLFCPTFKYNKTYNKHPLVAKDNFYNVPFKDLDKMLQNAIDIWQGTNTLFLLDDIANLHDVKTKCTKLCKLAFSARHYGFSVFVLTQKYNAIVKDFRDNIRMLILFYNKDKKSMTDAFDENNIVPKEEREDIIKFLYDNKHSKVIIRLEQPFNFWLHK